MRPGLFDSAPFMVFWEMTQACDLACRHCRACAVPERAAGELTTAEAEALLRDVWAMGTRLVVLTGGDPAKREDLIHLVRFGTELGLRMALTPSATPLVTRELLVELKQAGLARLAVSLDGASHAAHDDFRRVLGSCARTFDILKEAHELGITTQINTTVTRFNVHELERIAEQVKPLGIELWSVFFVVPTGRASEADVLDPDEVEGILERLAAIAETAPYDVKTTAAPHFRRVLLERKVRRSEITGIADGIGRAPRGVNDGQGIAFVSHQGEIFPSGFLPVDCGNIRTDRLADVYREHELFRALREPDGYSGKCGVCEFRYVCGGSRARAHAMTGEALASDPACAHQPRRPVKSEEGASAEQAAEHRRGRARKRLVVIGGGVAGLAAAWEARVRRPDVETILLESSERVGGLVETDTTRPGFVIEQGPDCVATFKPAAIELAHRLGLDAEIETAGVAARQAFIVSAGKLHPIPEGILTFSPAAIARVGLSPLLSLAGKARAALESGVPQRAAGDDESVHSFISRRFGPEVSSKLVEPLLTGLYGASASDLSMEALLPRLRDLERSHGSVTVGMARRSAPPANGGPPAVTFRRGMEALPAALAANLGGSIRTQAPVRTVWRERSGAWVVALAGGEHVHADAVIVATPVWTAARLLEKLDPTLSEELNAVRGSDLAVVTLSWNRVDFPELFEGTGFLVPESEGTRLSACTWANRKWHGRAPKDAEVLRCFLRGAFSSDEDAIAAALADLRSLLGIEHPPAFTVVRRQARVLPIYEVGHMARVRGWQERVAQHPTLALAGNAYAGVGLGDVIGTAHAAVERVLAQLAQPAQSTADEARNDA
jgi:protoporphyrinogen oxidase